MFFQICFPVTTAAVAVILDLRTGRVDNGWILFSIAVEGAFCILTGGEVRPSLAGAVIPAVCLSPLFLFRMLGPGDIKLFMALGCMLGADRIVTCMLLTFLFGGGISAALLIFCGDFAQRLGYFCEYVQKYLATGEIRPYYKRDVAALENFHFTIPVFMSVVLYAGGVY